jgi:ribosome-associated protein
VADTMVIARGIEVSRDEVSLEFSRSSGPGGQHVNKTESRVTLRFNLRETNAIPAADKARMLEKLASQVTKTGDILVSSETYRDRQRNIETAFERMEALLARAFVKPKPRKKTKPSRGAKERRLEEKRRTSSRKTTRKSPGRDE